MHGGNEGNGALRVDACWLRHALLAILEKPCNRLVEEQPAAVGLHYESF
jgi:hypothetical protein